jgi:Anti-sigma factor NepR
MRPAKKHDHLEELPNRVRERIGEQLREYYRAYASEQVPPRLAELIKTLEEKSDPTEEPLLKKE